MSAILQLMQQDFNHTSNKHIKYVLITIISQLKLKNLSTDEDIKEFTLSFCNQQIENIQNYFKNKKLSVLERNSCLLTDVSTLLISHENFGINIKKNKDAILVIKEYKSIEDKYFSQDESDDEDIQVEDFIDQSHLSDTVSFIFKKALDFID